VSIWSLPPSPARSSRDAPFHPGTYVCAEVRLAWGSSNGNSAKESQQQLLHRSNGRGRFAIMEEGASARGGLLRSPVRKPTGQRSLRHRCSAWVQLRKHHILVVINEGAVLANVEALDSHTIPD
jgi:hypothetical protein